MTLVVLQPAGNKDAREHYVDTIENPVTLDSIKDQLTSEEFDELSNKFPKGFVFFWGVTPGKNNANVGKWDKISEGDVVLFAREKYIYSSGVVASKLHNKKLATHLWSVNADGETWEYMYSIDEVRPVQISKLEFNELVGYKPGNQIMGVTVMNEERSQIFLDQYDLWSERHLPPASEEELDDALFVLDGDLDKKVQTAQRTEQGIARKKLLKNKQIAPCRLCGREMSKDFLVAAHIKKRSRCTDAEKRDLVNVTMLCCRFGCDELYERGFLGVDQDGKILVSSQLLDSTAKDYSTNIVQKRITLSQGEEKYFLWHLENMYRR
jgi:hypothetical protein